MSTIQFTRKAAQDLAKAYSTPDVIAQRETTLKLLAPQRGERVVDVGCGPGFLCESMAEAVGEDGHVLGVDISEDLIDICRARAPSAQLDYKVGDALVLPVADAEVDVAVCTQVAEYIPDTTTVLKELYRVIRPGGRVLIMATDWDCLACFTEEPERLQRVLRAWEGHCAHSRLPRRLPFLLRDHGFGNVAAATHPLINLNFDRKTYAYGIAKLMRDYVPEAGVPEEEAAAWFDELTRLDEAGRFYFASARMIFTAQKPA